MYNMNEQQFDKIQFVGDIGEILSTLTLKTPIVTMYRPEMLIEIVQYQLAGVFVGDLDFLANFSGSRARQRNGHACSALPARTDYRTVSNWVPTLLGLESARE